MDQDQLSINNEIQKIREELSEKIKTVKRVKQNNMFENFKFYVIAGVCIFFTWVILDNTIKTLSLYFRNRKREKEHKMKLSAPDNNEFEPEYSINTKIEDKMRKNLQRASENQNKQLHLAKKEKLISTNTELSDREIRKMPLDGNIDIQSLDKEHDEYKYDKTKKGVSFWDMVFQSKDVSNIP